jgi:hypothetical protein
MYLLKYLILSRPEKVGLLYFSSFNYFEFKENIPSTNQQTLQRRNSSNFKMTTVIAIVTPTAGSATSVFSTDGITTFTTSPPTRYSTPTSGYASAIEYYGDGDNYCSESHSLAMAAGVGIAAGVIVALIIILGFVFIRRRQTRPRKITPTISPNVLVTGPMVDDTHEWEEYHEEPKDVVRSAGCLMKNEPPMYTKTV